MQPTKNIVDLLAAEGGLWDGPSRPIDHALATEAVLAATATWLAQELYALAARLDAEAHRWLVAGIDSCARTRNAYEQRVSELEARNAELEAEIDERDEALDSLLPYAPDEQAEAA